MRDALVWMGRKTAPSALVPRWQTLLMPLKEQKRTTGKGPLDPDWMTNAARMRIVRTRSCPSFLIASKPILSPASHAAWQSSFVHSRQLLLQRGIPAAKGGVGAVPGEATSTGNIKHSAGIYRSPQRRLTNPTARAGRSHTMPVAYKHNA